MKKILKYIIPYLILLKGHDLFYSLKDLYYRHRIRKIKKIFKGSLKSPNWLSISDLEELQKKYPYPPVGGYDRDTLEKRGKYRAQELIKIIPDKKAKYFLELGCWDGMVSCFLQKSGRSTIAIDNRDEGFDKRASLEGVKLLKMSASNLKFNDSSFDVVFSYASFEHFEEPESVLKEAYRVLKPGGHIFLTFGPLYLSPMGLHAYHLISVPWCHLLFNRPTLDIFLKKNLLPPIDYSQCNGWSLIQFRELWQKFSDCLKILYNREDYNYAYVDLIEKYSSCFRNKSDYFDNLTCESITVLFRKK